mmetsp:Transcript_41090/g.108775  ORF Transcript_41090/g.108775 Transcript_41090/m.108775 type:complete len:374 (+) Transcript_41090:2350-3471(+)
MAFPDSSCSALPAGSARAFLLPAGNSSPPLLPLTPSGFPEPGRAFPSEPFPFLTAISFTFLPVPLLFGAMTTSSSPSLPSVIKGCLRFTVSLGALGSVWLEDEEDEDDSSSESGCTSSPRFGSARSFFSSSLDELDSSEALPEVGARTVAASDFPMVGSTGCGLIFACGSAVGLTRCGSKLGADVSTRECVDIDGSGVGSTRADLGVFCGRGSSDLPRFTAVSSLSESDSDTWARGVKGSVPLSSDRAASPVTDGNATSHSVVGNVAGKEGDSDSALAVGKICTTGMAASLASTTGSGLARLALHTGVDATSTAARTGIATASNEDGTGMDISIVSGGTGFKTIPLLRGTGLNCSGETEPSTGEPSGDDSSAE